MKKFNIIWIFVFSLLFIYSTNTVNAVSSTCVLLNQSCPTGGSQISDNFTNWGTNACAIRNGLCDCDFDAGGAFEKMSYKHKFGNYVDFTTNMTITWVNLTIAEQASRTIHLDTVNGTSDVNSDGNQRLEQRDIERTAWQDNGGLGAIQILSDDPFANFYSEFRLEYYLNVSGTSDNTALSIFVNGTERVQLNPTSLNNNSYLYILAELTGDSISWASFSNENTTVQDNGEQCADVADETPPVVTIGFNKSSPIESGHIINISGNATDGDGTIDNMNITHNITFDGSLVILNFTSLTLATEGIFNVTKFAPAGIFNITIYATDDSNNLHQNSTLFTVTEGLPPEGIVINLTSEVTNNGEGQVIYSIVDSVDVKQSGVIVRTNDTTPTFILKTDEGATCAVIDANNDLNFTDIIAISSSAQCETTGGTSHTCTTTASDTVQIGLNNFSFGCEDLIGHQNSTATSGKFLVNITDNVPPRVNLDQPENGTTFTVNVNNTITFNFTCTETY